MSVGVQLAHSRPVQICGDREENIEQLQVAVCGFRGSIKTHEQLYVSTNCGELDREVICLIINCGILGGFNRK